MKIEILNIRKNVYQQCKEIQKEKKEIQNDEHNLMEAKLRKHTDAF
jgi:ribosome recycling factor